MNGKKSAAEASSIESLAEIGDLNIPRWRDSWISKKKPAIKVLARIGGGNREEYENDIEEIQDHPNYVSDKDWEEDTTYAIFTFHIPEHNQDRWRAATRIADNIVPDDILLPQLAECTEHL